MILTRIRFVAGRLDRDVGLAEHDEQVAGAGVLQFARHVQIGVHPRLQDRDAADALELGRMGVEIEGAGDHDVEPGVGRLARRVDEIGARHGAEFGAEKDRRAALAVPFEVAAFGADQIARPRRQRREGDAVLLVRLLHARCL